jgi:ssDNA-binding Zn-finger/Zn-ribbon topoisomerase 1
MGNFIEIQKNIDCEPCKECGARPVIEQIKGGFIVRCPQNKSHYKTKAGLVNIEDWNIKNRVLPPLGNATNPQKAS